MKSRDRWLHKQIDEGIMRGCNVFSIRGFNTQKQPIQEKIDENIDRE